MRNIGEYSGIENIRFEFSYPLDLKSGQSRSVYYTEYNNCNITLGHSTRVTIDIFRLTVVKLTVICFERCLSYENSTDVVILPALSFYESWSLI